MLKNLNADTALRLFPANSTKMAGTLSDAFGRFRTCFTSRLLKNYSSIHRLGALRKGMRGADEQQSQIFSYLSPEARVRKDHPLRAIRVMVDEALAQVSGCFDAMYAEVGRPSIAPEKLLRAQLLQMLYSVRSECLLIEEMDYNLLFRWFVGLNADDEVWDATTFTN